MSKLLILALLVLAISSMSTTHDGKRQRRLTNKFKLKFDYAATQGKPLEQSAFTVSWNGKAFEEIFPKTYDVTPVTYTVFAIVGENIINFSGTGSDSAAGVSITNVELVRRGKCGLDDPLLNGNFIDLIKASGQNSQTYNDKVKGWKGSKIEVGRGSIYNAAWSSSDYVTVLRPGYDIYQSIFLDPKWEQTSSDQATVRGG